MLKKRSKFKGSRPELAIITAPQSPAAEQFRRLRANLNFLPSNESVQSLVITSSAPSEGKSWVAANLAVLYASEGKKVLLVDCNMRDPAAHEIFRSKNDIGLSSVLSGQEAAGTAIQKTAVDHLDLLSCGLLPPNPAELITSEPMNQFMESVKKSYDMVIYDSPPLLSVVDGQILSNKCDGSILVINAGKTDRQDAVKAKEMIASSNGKLLGVILNHSPAPAISCQ